MHMRGGAARMETEENAMDDRGVRLAAHQARRVMLILTRLPSSAELE